MKGFIVVFFTFLIIFSFVRTVCHADKRALLVGISDYRDEKVNKLKGPLNDVRIIKEALITYYAFSENEVKILTNDQATRQNIEKSFHQWLVQGSRRGDLVLFYFAGHGAQVEDFNGDEDDKMDEVLLPYDVVPRGGDNLITDDELGQWLRKLRNRNALVIIDACHSGGTRRSIKDETVSIPEQTETWRPRFYPVRDYEPRTPLKAILPAADLPGVNVFMAASKEGEAALEFEVSVGVCHGGFSYGMYQGMKTLRAPTYGDIFEFARKVVKDRLRLSQEPLVIAAEGSLLKPFLEITPTQHPPAIPSPISAFAAKKQGEKLLLAIEHLDGVNLSEMKQLRAEISQLPNLTLVLPNGYFDRLLRGGKRAGRYRTRLLNQLGDVERVESVRTREELVKQLARHLEYASMVKHLARIFNPSPSFNIKLTVKDEPRRDFRLWEKVTFIVRSQKDCYILLISLDKYGNFHIIFPNKFFPREFHLKANTVLTIPDDQMTKFFEFALTPPSGEETVKLIATTQPLNLELLDSKAFEQNFLTLKDNSRAQLIQQIIDHIKRGVFEIKTGKEQFQWSEDTIVIRSHDNKKAGG